MSVLIIVLNEFSGDVISDVNSRKGKIIGMETKSNKDQIEAELLEEYVWIHHRFEIKNTRSEALTR